jgi:hypothetical protein
MISAFSLAALRVNYQRFPTKLVPQSWMLLVELIHYGRQKKDQYCCAGPDKRVLE